MKKSGKEFMDATKYSSLGTTDREKGYKQPPLEAKDGMKGSALSIPAPDRLKSGEGMLLNSAINRRISRRKYTETPLAPEELSYLLWCTQGVKNMVRDTITFRTVPSAGARHALDTYLLINRVETFRQGIYRFAAIAHKLVEYNMERDIAEKVAKACLGQEFVLHSAVTFIWVADSYRMTWRYGERGYRYLHLDAGHICQNLYLAAEAIDAGACAIAAFDDDALNGLLELDGADRFVIYAAAAGKK